MPTLGMPQPATPPATPRVHPLLLLPPPLLASASQAEQVEEMKAHVDKGELRERRLKTQARHSTCTPSVHTPLSTPSLHSLSSPAQVSEEKRKTEEVEVVLTRVLNDLRAKGMKIEARTALAGRR